MDFPAEPATSGLAERLAEAASATVLQHRRALEYGGRLQSVHIELELSSTGQVSASHFWPELISRGRPSSGLR